MSEIRNIYENTTSVIRQLDQENTNFESFLESPYRRSLIFAFPAHSGGRGLPPRIQRKHKTNTAKMRIS